MKKLKGEMNMLEKIYFEVYVIRQTVKAAWKRMIQHRSLVPVWSMFFNPDCRYQINDGEWKYGNYYTFMRDFWGGVKKD